MFDGIPEQLGLDQIEKSRFTPAAKLGAPKVPRVLSRVSTARQGVMETYDD
jgi:hypothetical protein